MNGVMDRKDGMDRRDGVDGLEWERAAVAKAWPGMMAGGAADAGPVAVLPFLGMVQWWSGRPTRARGTLRRGRRVAEAAGAEFVVLHCRVREVEIGRVMEGADRVEEEAGAVKGLIEAKGWGDRYPLNLAHVSTAWCAWQRGEMLHARRQLERVMRAADRLAPPERAELALLEAELLMAEGEPVIAGGVLGRALARPEADVPDMLRARLTAARCRAGRAAGTGAGAVDAAGVPGMANIAGKDIAFTGREMEILRLLPAPMTVREIALREHVSVNTVKSQLKSIYRKLEADNRRSAVRLARRYGVL